MTILETLRLIRTTAESGRITPALELLSFVIDNVESYDNGIEANRELLELGDRESDEAIIQAFNEIALARIESQFGGNNEPEPPLQAA